MEYTNMLLYILYIFSQAVFIFLLSSSFFLVYNNIWLNCCNFLFFTNYRKCNNLNLPLDTRGRNSCHAYLFGHKSHTSVSHSYGMLMNNIYKNFRMPKFLHPSLPYESCFWIGYSRHSLYFALSHSYWIAILLIIL